MPSGRAKWSNPGPARYARTTKASDSKGFGMMQYCPEDSSSWVERGAAERYNTVATCETRKSGDLLPCQNNNVVVTEC